MFNAKRLAAALGHLSGATEGQAPATELDTAVGGQGPDVAEQLAGLPQAAQANMFADAVIPSKGIIATARRYNLPLPNAFLGEDV